MGRGLLDEQLHLCWDIQSVIVREVPTWVERHKHFNLHLVTTHPVLWRSCPRSPCQRTSHASMEDTPQLDLQIH